MKKNVPDHMSADVILYMKSEPFFTFPTYMCVIYYSFPHNVFFGKTRVAVTFQKVFFKETV